MIGFLSSKYCLSFYQDAKPLGPPRPCAKDQSVHRPTVDEIMRDCIPESHSTFNTCFFPPPAIRIANKASFITSVLQLTIQTVHYPVSHASNSGEAKRLASESRFLKTISPSFEVNISRKALSYSLRYPWINNLMGTNTGSVHE